MINRIQLTVNFGLEEFECPHCGAVRLHPKLVEKLQRLRDRLGKPLVVLSAYRCPEHNKAVGGVPKSQHLLGTAADIAAGPTGFTPQTLADLAETVGFTGIGVYKESGFVHVDVRDEHVKWEGQ